MYYSYDYSLPDTLMREINSIVKEFAGNTNASYNAMRYDLPMWIVSAENGSRTNVVQIDAIVVSHRELLVFNPDAYEDELMHANEFITVSRKTVEPDHIREHSSTLDVNDLLHEAHSNDGVIRATIWHHLADAWEAAKLLPLTHVETWVESQS